MKRRIWIAAAMGAGIVLAASLLNHVEAAAGPTAVMLSPGLLAGALAMGGIDPEANTTFTPLAGAVMYGVNFLFYAGICWAGWSIGAGLKKNKPVA